MLNYIVFAVSTSHLPQHCISKPLVRHLLSPIHQALHLCLLFWGDMDVGGWMNADVTNGALVCNFAFFFFYLAVLFTSLIFT